jgi:dTDP-N-acetylfucosamine:lipid II N-acetylfucosaminyltransferase
MNKILNLHLTNDDKFINPFIKRFEDNCEGDNYYIVDVANENKLKYIRISESSKIICYSFKEDLVFRYISGKFNDSQEVNVFIHFLDYKKAKIIHILKEKFEFKTYWIFYGADLYNRLYKKGRYELYDIQKNFVLSYIWRYGRRLFYYLRHSSEERIIRKFIQNLDFFCFWNPYDFQLLKKNYTTQARFKNFMYDSFDVTNLNEFHSPLSDVTCLINHSSSSSGNHLTVLKKIKNFKDDDSFIHKLIIPLNYGLVGVRELVKEYCEHNFTNSFVPLLEFIPKSTYFKILNTVNVAIFGHRRQEAGGNIIYLLAAGTKVFLREDNSLLQYFRDNEIVIFSFENDLNCNRDLSPLPLSTQQRNRDIIINKFSNSSVNILFRDLL